MFTIHVNPYFLRLNFSKPVVEDDDSSANYDPTSGYLTVTLTKETKGEAFEDLDLLAKLLAPRPRVREHSPSIEVLHSESDDLASKTESLSLNHSEILEGIYISHPYLISRHYQTTIEIYSFWTRLATTSRTSRTTVYLITSTLWLLESAFRVSQTCNPYRK